MLFAHGGAPFSNSILVKSYQQRTQVKRGVVKPDPQPGRRRERGLDAECSLTAHTHTPCLPRHQACCAPPVCGVPCAAVRPPARCSVRQRPARRPASVGAPPPELGLHIAPARTAMCADLSSAGHHRPAPLFSSSPRITSTASLSLIHPGLASVRSPPPTAARRRRQRTAPRLCSPPRTKKLGTSTKLLVVHGLGVHDLLATARNLHNDVKVLLLAKVIHDLLRQLGGARHLGRRQRAGKLDVRPAAKRESRRRGVSTRRERRARGCESLGLIAWAVAGQGLWGRLLTSRHLR